MSKHAAKKPRALAHARGVGRSIFADFATRSNAAVAVVLALAGVFGLRGGFDEAAPEGFVSASVASQTSPVQVEAQPFEIEIQRSYIAEGARVVEMQLNNTSERPIGGTELQLAFDLEDSSKGHDEQPRFTRSINRFYEQREGEVPRDTFVSANPGVPVDIAVIFSPGDGGDERALEAADTLVISTMEYRRSTLLDSMGWFSGIRMVEVDLK